MSLLIQKNRLRVDVAQCCCGLCSLDVQRTALTTIPFYGIYSGNLNLRDQAIVLKSRHLVTAESIQI